MSSTGGHHSSNRVVNDLGKRLLEAARNGNTEEVKQLMTNGAPLTTDWLGTTPLHLASIYGHTSTAEILIKSGINRDSRTKVDKAPLHFACQHGHMEIVKLLVSGGAHINATDMLKMTPLHWAVEANKFEICLILIKAGANTDLKNKFGKTALKIATEKKYNSIVQILSAEKIKILQELDMLGQQDFRNHSVTSVEICRPGDFNNLKKQKTHRFPMVAGTWTGGEPQSIDRQDMHERKMFGNFNKKRPLVSSHTDVLSPSLGNLQLSKNKKIEDTSKGRSPLQQLVETVRQSTSNLESDNPPRTIKPIKTTEIYDTKKEDGNMDSERTTCLPSNIPVISSLALKSLPPNIKAIPLQMNIRDHLDATDVKQPENKPPQKQDGQPALKPALDVPIELLNQIINGEVTLHSLSSNSKEEADNNLVAINTEMGTIPIIPVKGEGGLQLIPVQKEAHRHPSPPISHLMRHPPPAVVYPGNRPRYPVSLVRHPPTTGGQLFESEGLKVSTVSSQQVRTPMLVPTGIYVQPGHPAFLQLHRPPPHSSAPPGQISIYPPPQRQFTHPTQPPLIPTTPILQPTGRPQFLVHPAATRGSAAFVQPHLPTSYVYVERDDG